MKTALITGITGQDGSYLAELLLNQGYRVVGMTRRSSTDVHERIEHLGERIEIVSGDLLDQSSISAIVAAVEPDEIYNLAAQSFVPTSWSQPVLTGEFTALGATRVLEAVRHARKPIRFYQASSSEMFGKVLEVPQRESTPFYPRSPYGVAKVYGHWITVNYRESFDMFACSGILFNHESIPGSTPVIVREGNRVDIRPVGEIMPVREKGANYQDRAIDSLEVWDGQAFVHVLGASAYRHRPVVANKGVRRIEARCGTVTTTADHVVFTSAGERAARTVEPGHGMHLTALPDVPAFGRLSLDEAWLLGAFVGDDSAYVDADHMRACFKNDDVRFRLQFAQTWQRVTCGTTETSTASGPDAGGTVGALALNGASTYVAWLREVCYTGSGHKRVPQVVLNGDEAVWRAFLCGYAHAGGLEAGHESHVYEKFETNSETLALGLWWMANRALEQTCVLSVEAGSPQGPGPVYSIDLGSPNTDGSRAHVQRDRAEVERIVELPHFEGWLYDLTTASGKFHAGVGELTIHNSPRRGKEFVTRKITDGVARIKLGMQQKLSLGNLDAQRDWGFAGDYVRAMWLMLQQDAPDDYVVATGRTHAVREFVRIAFASVGLPYEDYVVIDPKFMRPAEVEMLVGDASKARERLGWVPETSFEQLVEMMVQADLARLQSLAHR